MSNLIGFGKCSKYYLYILFTIILKSLKDVIFGFSYIDPKIDDDSDSDSDPDFFDSLLSSHVLIQNILRYLGFILCGYIFLKIKEKNNPSKNKPLITQYEDSNSDIKLIQLNINTKLIISKKFSRSEIIIIAVIYTIHYELTRILYSMNYYYLDIWTFDLMFIILFMYIHFKIKLYNYQKCSLIFIIITNTLLILISTSFPQIKEDNTKNTKTNTNKNVYDLIEETTGSELFCIPINLLFITLSCFISFARVKIKLITYIKFIPIYSIIIYIGVIGTILTFIELLFSSFFQCNSQEMNELLCLVNDTNNNSTYYDNIIIYFNELSENFPKFAFFKEILIINLSYPIISFFEMVCELLIIYYLHPIYILIRDNIYYFFMRIIFIISKRNYFYLENPTFYITQAADLFAIFGYCVFLQLIELKFYRFDYDLNKNIIERGKKEANINFEEDVSEVSGNSEEEEEKQQRKLSDDSLYS